MHLVDFILLAISTVAAICAGWGYSMISLPHPKVRAARLSFWLSGIAFWSLGIVWAMTSHEGLAVRLGVSGLTGAVAAMALTWALWEVRFQAEAKQDDKTTSGNQIGSVTNNKGIVSQNQTGNINMNVPAKKSGVSAQNDLPKAGDMIGGFGAGMPRSGDLPKAGDILGGFGAGLPNQGARQPAPSSTPKPGAAEQSGATGTSNYSIGNIYDNKGIIQQGPNNTVNLAPQPELRGIQADQIPNADGTFTHRYLVEWTAEFPGDWRIEAFGDSVLAISTSAQQFGHSGIRDDHAFTTINRPHGRYTIFVQTRTTSKVELKHTVIR